ncbi:MAG: ABC transporter permease subunit [Lachnospiraceae bacterium]|nr:ABC transporter permease subunit [Lachnospiraceae bacterium]
MTEKTEHINLTAKELNELERADEGTALKFKKRIIAALPIVAALIHLLEYNYYPNYRLNTCTDVYNRFIGILLAAYAVAYILSFFSAKVYGYIYHKSAFYTVLMLLLTAYDFATLKTGKLALPYFPWVDSILNAMIEDREKLLDCVLHSLVLLFNGYFKGVIAGLICGIGAGWSKKISYWVYPVAKVLGAIPSTTYMPIVVMVAASLFQGAAFIIALGVWVPVTLTSMTGVQAVRKHYYEAAETLGTSKTGILFRVAIPAAMPNVFAGLTQGMSVACLTLVVAEMMGVESGLGWYVNWQKSWAAFAKIYGALIIICITFIITNGVLNLIKKRVLRWQKD